MTRGSVALVLVAGLVGCNECSNPCDINGEGWCEGNVRHVCTFIAWGYGENGDPEYEIREYPCDPGLTCVDFIGPSFMVEPVTRSHALCLDLSVCDTRSAFCRWTGYMDGLVTCPEPGGEVTVTYCDQYDGCHCVEEGTSARCTPEGGCCPYTCGRDADADAPDAPASD